MVRQPSGVGIGVVTSQHLPQRAGPTNATASCRRLAIVSMGSLVLFLKVWKPRKVWTSTALKGHEKDSGVPDLGSEKPQGHEADAGAAIFAKNDTRAVVLAWLPWAILTVFVFVWGIPAFKQALAPRR